MIEPFRSNASIIWLSNRLTACCNDMMMQRECWYIWHYPLKRRLFVCSFAWNVLHIFLDALASLRHGSPVRCPLWAHGLSSVWCPIWVPWCLWSSFLCTLWCCFASRCTRGFVLCTLLCCFFSSWCTHGFVYPTLFSSTMYNVQHMVVYVFEISNLTHKPHFLVLAQSRGQFWRWTMEGSNLTHKPHFLVLPQSRGQFWRWTREVSNLTHKLHFWFHRKAEINSGGGLWF